MKKILLLAFILLVAKNVSAQDITGDWNGVLKVQTTNLRLVFHVSQKGSDYSCTMDSPEQGAKGIPMTSTQYVNNVLTITMTAAGIEYTGTLNKSGEIEGTFKQGGLSFPLTLGRKAIEKKQALRPQNPTAPYPYYSEEVKINNAKDQLTLAGTLTLPSKEGKFPVVVLVTGSGPQNRDEELAEHKPFLVLADFLTRNGIGVLRYDDRGTASSTGNFSTATSADFANDAEAAVDFLVTQKHIDKKHIGIIGHSEGGLIAPIVANRNKNVNFIILMAGPALSGADILLQQQKLIAEVSGAKADDVKKHQELSETIYDLVKSIKNPVTLETELTSYLKNHIKDIPNFSIPKGTSEDFVIEQMIKQFTSPWMKNFIVYNPAPQLELVKCAVLALNGSKDLQVPAKTNVPALRDALHANKNPHTKVKELSGLNHLFQECTTGAPVEYGQIEQTISPTALNTMLEWIKETVADKKQH